MAIIGSLRLPTTQDCSQAGVLCRISTGGSRMITLIDMIHTSLRYFRMQLVLCQRYIFGRTNLYERCNHSKRIFVVNFNVSSTLCLISFYIFQTIQYGCYRLVIHVLFYNWLTIRTIHKELCVNFRLKLNLLLFIIYLLYVLFVFKIKINN